MIAHIAGDEQHGTSKPVGRHDAAETLALSRTMFQWRMGDLIILRHFIVHSMGQSVIFVLTKETKANTRHTSSCDKGTDRQPEFDPRGPARTALLRMVSAVLRGETGTADRQRAKQLKG